MRKSWGQNIQQLPEETLRLSNSCSTGNAIFIFRAIQRGCYPLDIDRQWNDHTASSNLQNVWETENPGLHKFKPPDRNTWFTFDTLVVDQVPTKQLYGQWLPSVQHTILPKRSLCMQYRSFDFSNY